MPSHFEPWGVVVQEYAASGFPIITSSAVGAKEAFLTDNKNGYSFEPKNIDQLKHILKKIITLNNEELLRMSESSHLMAQKINPENWCRTINEFYDEFNKK